MANDIFKQRDVKLDTFIEKNVQAVTSFSQGDNSSAKLIIDLSNEDEKLDLTEAEQVRIDFRKPDKKLVFQYCTMEDKPNGIVSVVLHTQTVAVPGNVDAEVTVIYPNGKKVVTKKFSFHVNEAISGAESLESANVLPMLDKAIEAGEKLEGVDVDGIIAAGTKAEDAKVTAEAAQKTADEAEVKADTNKNKIESLTENTFPFRKTKPKTAAVFIDDDGKAEVWTKLKPTFEQYGVPLTLAIIDSWIDKPDCLSLDQILHLQNELGWEMASHTINHIHLAETAVTNPAEAKREIFESKRFLSEKGLHIESLVYPFGDNSEVVNDFTRDALYLSGVDTFEGINNMPVDTYQLKRIAMGSYFATPSAEYPITTTFNDYYKPRVDEAIAKNGLIIFKLHCASAEHTEDQQNYIKQTIEYLQSKNVPIVNLRDALKTFRNNVDFGTNNASNDYTIIDASGKLYSSQLMVNIGGNIKDVNAPLDTVACPIRKETVQFVSYADRTGWPENKAGTLRTGHYPDATYVYRMYYPTGSNKIYKQNWDNTNKVWSAFELINGVETIKKAAINAVTPAHTITDPALEAGKVTYVPINTSGATGFPKDQAGLLIVDRINDSNGYRYERYLQYQSNRQYIRNTTSAGDLKQWDELARKDDSYTKTCTFGKVSPQSHLEFDTGYTGTMGEFVLLSPTNGTLIDGVSFTGYINAAGKIIVRVVNYTAAEITVANKDFRITVIKAF